MYTLRQWVAWGGVTLALTAALAGPAAPARAADEEAGGTVSRRDLDEQVNQALRQVINDGREYFNTGYPGECAYIFRGGLVAVKPLLRHHPRIQKAIDRGLADAERLPTLRQQAFALRKVIDSVRDEVAPAMLEVGEGDTLWERLGKEKNATRIVDDWVDALIADPKVNFFRDGRFKMTREQLGP
jgi:hypothetical protein